MSVTTPSVPLLEPLLNMYLSLPENDLETLGKKSDNHYKLKSPKFPNEDLGQPMKIITNIDKPGHGRKTKFIYHFPYF